MTTRQENGGDDGYFDVDKLDNFERAYSEHDHYEGTVKRNNFIALFLDEYNADVFVATHLYGAINNMADEVSPQEIDALMNTSAAALG